MIFYFLITLFACLCFYVIAKKFANNQLFKLNEELDMSKMTPEHQKFLQDQLDKEAEHEKYHHAIYELSYDDLVSLQKLVMTNVEKFGITCGHCCQAIIQRNLEIKKYDTYIANEEQIIKDFLSNKENK